LSEPAPPKKVPARKTAPAASESLPAVPTPAQEDPSKFGCKGAEETAQKRKSKKKESRAGDRLLPDPIERLIADNAVKIAVGYTVVVRGYLDDESEVREFITYCYGIAVRSFKKSVNYEGKVPQYCDRFREYVCTLCSVRVGIY